MTRRRSTSAVCSAAAAQTGCSVGWMYPWRPKKVYSVQCAPQQVSVPPLAGCLAAALLGLLCWPDASRWRSSLPLSSSCPQLRKRKLVRISHGAPTRRQEFLAGYGPTVRTEHLLATSSSGPRVALSPDTWRQTLTSLGSTTAKANPNKAMTGSGSSCRATANRSCSQIR